MSQLFFVVAFFCASVAVWSLWQSYNPNRLAFAQTTNDVVNVAPQSSLGAAQSLPVRLTIPRLMLSLPIEPARASGGSWEVTTKGVSYLISSPKPGEKGNSVLYGHNWQSLLGPIRSLHVNDTIQIVYPHETKSFTVVYTAEVTPDSTYLIENTSDTRLTLYTCSGFLDSKRFVVTATPVL